jgi:hypothetical protein
MAYTSAGCMFLGENHVLAGFQNKPAPCISGIGGKKQGDEIFFETAIREMLEELLGIYNTDLIDPLLYIEYEKVVNNGDYYIVVYTFSALEKMLRLVKHLGCSSPFYSELPLSVCDLVFKRKTSYANAAQEITHLCILPLTAGPIKRHFLEDLRMVSESLIQSTQE